MRRENMPRSPAARAGGACTTAEACPSRRARAARASRRCLRARAAGRAAASWKTPAPREGAVLPPRPRRRRRWDSLDSAVLPAELLELQAEQLDEPLGGAVIEAVLDAVGAERVV